MITILTADMLRVEQLSRTTPAQNIQQGREDYQLALLRRERCEADGPVQGTRSSAFGLSYHVSLWLQSQQVAMTFTCREGHQWYRAAIGSPRSWRCAIT